MGLDRKRTALLIGALVVAMGTALVARSVFSGVGNIPAPPAMALPAPVQGPKILVATRDLPAGTIIGPDSYRFQPWPSELIDTAYFKEGQTPDLASLSGQVVRLPITAGQPITRSTLIKPGDRGFLAAALGPGMRAITVGVSAESGVAGFIFPGDRVDMVLTQTIETGETPLRASETIIRNLRVLATDQQAMPTDQDGKRTARVSQTVTLEVTPRLAEKISVAQALGQLSLTLRAIADTPAELERAIAKGDVTISGTASAKTEQGLALEMAARPSDLNPSYVTGADVSHFQGRGAPRAASAPAAASKSAAPAVPSSPASGSRNPGPALRVWRSSVPETAVF